MVTKIKTRTCFTLLCKTLVGLYRLLITSVFVVPFGKMDSSDRLFCYHLHGPYPEYRSCKIETQDFFYWVIHSPRVFRGYGKLNFHPPTLYLIYLT